MLVIDHQPPLTEFVSMVLESKDGTAIQTYQPNFLEILADPDVVRIEIARPRRLSTTSEAQEMLAQLQKVLAEPPQSRPQFETRKERRRRKRKERKERNRARHR